MKYSFSQMPPFPSAPQALKAKTKVLLFERIASGERRRSPTLRARAGLIVAAFCALFITLGSTFYFKETAIISIDVNPSIELSLNSLGRVIGALGYNEDGREILSALPLQNRRYSEAVSRILIEESERGLLSESSVVAFAVLSEDEAARDKILSLLHESTAWLAPERVHCSTVTPELAKEARESGLSLGRYEAISQLLAADPSATLKSCEHSSMSEIYERTERACSGGQKNCGNGGGGQGHHGKRMVR